MVTLSYGYKKPVNGDRGSVWFPALEDNITRLNTHSHDGSDSALLHITSISRTTQDIAAGSWAHQGGGTYKQTITMPGSLLFADVGTKFYINGGSDDGAEISPTVVRASINTYDVYVNDNTLALKVLYL